ncbi:hypothetical protein Tco_1488074, partial [Tanacetum coccineum]
VNGSQFNHNITTKDKNPKPNPSSYPNNIPLKNKDKFPDLPLFASVISKYTVDTSSTNANIRALVLDDQDLVNVKDPSMVLLVKLKDVNSMSNMYVICRNEGFTELKIHHVGGLWIWIQFPSSSSADNFQSNASLKSVYSCIKTATPSFKVDEHMIWIEIRGLTLCAWGSNAYKKVVDMFGKFMFFEAEESTKMSSDVNGMEKVEDSVDKNSLADLNDLKDLKETINELASNKIQHPISKENMDQEDDIKKCGMKKWRKRVWIKTYVSSITFIFSAHGRSRGMISMWDPNSFIKDDIWFDDAFIIVKGHWRNKDGDCYMIKIYGPQDSLACRIKLVILCTNTLDANNFNSFIDNYGLIDLPVGGRLLIWINKAGTKLSKLDRFLISEEVTEALPNVRVTAIDRL